MLEFVESAVSAILATLAAVSMLAHSLAGCCWHHTHVCEVLADSMAIDFPGGHSHAGMLQGACSSAHDCCHGEQREPEDCQGNRCVFVTATPARASAPLQPLGQLAATLVAGENPLPSELLSVQDRPAAGAALLPLRVHLFYRVLLI